jgi:hypothetical protein
MGALGFVALAGVAPAVAQTPPTITLSTTTATPGDHVTVTVSGYPDGPVVIAVCGSTAVDDFSSCDQPNAVSTISAGGTAPPVEIMVGTPPTPCPCVVRASDAAAAIIGSSPIELLGVALDTNVDATGPLTVTAELQEAPGNAALDTLRSGLGGPTNRILVLTLRNNTDVPMDHLSAGGTFGRDRNGDVLHIPAIAPLAPHEERRYEVPVEIGVVAWGRYLTSGVVNGVGDPIAFQAETSTVPWVLVIAVPFLVIDVMICVGVWMRRRRRTRERRLAMLRARTPLMR